MFSCVSFVNFSDLIFDCCRRHSHSPSLRLSSCSRNCFFHLSSFSSLSRSFRRVVSSFSWSSSSRPARSSSSSLSGCSFSSRFRRISSSFSVVSFFPFCSSRFFVSISTLFRSFPSSSFRFFALLFLSADVSFPPSLSSFGACFLSSPDFVPCPCSYNVNRSILTP